MRRSALFLLFLCALFALAFLGVKPAAARNTATVRDISVQDAAKMLRYKPANLLILDVRTPGEFRKGHIPGAKNIDFWGGSFESESAKLPQNATILLYCRTGKRSEAAAESLAESGRKKLLNLRDGVEGWEKAKLPLEK